MANDQLPMAQTGSPLARTGPTLGSGVPISNVTGVEVGPLPLALLGVGLVGVLLLIPGGVFTSSALATVGFAAALLGQAGLLAMLLKMKQK